MVKRTLEQQAADEELKHQQVPPSAPCTQTHSVPLQPGLLSGCGEGGCVPLAVKSGPRVKGPGLVPGAESPAASHFPGCWLCLVVFLPRPKFCPGRGSPGWSFNRTEAARTGQQGEAAPSPLPRVAGPLQCLQSEGRHPLPWNGGTAPPPTTGWLAGPTLHLS